jgi:hypothetical protein
MPLDGLRGFINTLTVASVERTAEASRQLLIETAIRERDRVIAEAMARSGFRPVYRQIVDGVVDAPLEAVRPDGIIVFSWQYLREVVRDILTALVARSPVLTGAYVESISVFVDDVELPRTIDLEHILDAIDISAQRVIIVPTVPYARRLEVGKTKSGRPFVVQVKPHIVEETAITMRRLYGTLVDVEFNYVDLSDAHLLTPAGRYARHFEQGRWVHDKSPRLRHGKPEIYVRYPAIILSPRLP